MRRDMLVLRHASAGVRVASPRLDRRRRLDDVGREDARLLPRTLFGYPISRIISSPHARCVESVEPLAFARGLAVEQRDELAPGAPEEAAAALLAELPDDALVCTHREVIESLFDGEVRCDKGGTLVLERHGVRVVPVAYLAPPTRRRRRANRVLV